MRNGVDALDLTRRERQIMEIVYRLGKARARDVLNEIPDPPSYSTVRKLLGILVEKGHLKCASEGNRLVYQARRSHRRAARGAMQRLLDVFYGGSVEEAVAGLLSLKRDELSPAQLNRLAELIETAQDGADTAPEE